MADTRIVAYPFVRVRLETWDADGASNVLSWRPGIRYVWIGPENTEAVAHGMGLMKLMVVSRHKPGRYPERVFYTRKWVDPEGKEFGKSRCLIATAEKFNRISKGYRIEYRIDPDAPIDGEY